MVKFSINWFSNLSTHECVLNVDKNLIINTQGEVKERKTINIDKVKYDSFELTVNCCPLKNMGKSNILQKIIGAIIGIFVFFGKDYYVFDFYNYSLRYLIYIDSVEPEVTLSINENKRHGLPSNTNIICKNCHIIKKEEESSKNYEFLFENRKNYCLCTEEKQHISQSDPISFFDKDISIPIDKIDFKF